MTDITTDTPPLTRRQAREIERRTGVRPVATTMPLPAAARAGTDTTIVAAAVAAPVTSIPTAASLAAAVRERIAVAAPATRAELRAAAAATPTTVATIAELAPAEKLDLVATTAELADATVAPIPAAFARSAAPRPVSVRAPRPAALVRRARRRRGAAVAVAASAAAVATVGAVVPGFGVAPDAAQASLVSADAVTQPAASAPVASAAEPAAFAPAVAAPETVVDRAEYQVTTVSADTVESVATEPAAPVISTSFVSPYPAGAVNEGYGTRGGNHNGIDMVGGGCGADLQAVAPGTVTFVGYQGGYGNHVEIRLDDGDVISYSHLQSSGPLSVGQRVNTGDYVGPVGTTGNSTGCHLHFEVKVNGSFVNPVGWLADRGIDVT